MKNVLITGGKGQLAHCIRDVSEGLKDYNFIFVDYDELDITNRSEVSDFFNKIKISYCVNCAAYTAVDKAESEKSLAYEINEGGVHNLAEFCKIYSSVLIQISTDFVFDGLQVYPYKEDHETNPLNVYGNSKLKGEIAVMNLLKDYFIIRTSWLYSEYGNNFLKTMLRLADESDELGVVSDQFGSPTYSRDLSSLIVKIIREDNRSFGIYHYSNEGEASWHDFAKSIFFESHKNVNLKPIKSIEYLTPARRPNYSVLDKSKIKNQFGLDIPHWQDSLKECLKRLNSVKKNA